MKLPVDDDQLGRGRGRVPLTFGSHRTMCRRGVCNQSALHPASYALQRTERERRLGRAGQNSCARRLSAFVSPRRRAGAARRKWLGWVPPSFEGPRGRTLPAGHAPLPATAARDYERLTRLEERHDFARPAIRHD